jgi:hypothetical protein
MPEAPRLDVELGWKVLKILPGWTISVRAVIEQSDKNGLFRYSIEHFFGPAEEDEGQWPEGFWQTQSYSGLYNSSVEILKDAQASIGRAEDAY